MFATWLVGGTVHRARLARTTDGRLVAVPLTDDGPRTVWEGWSGMQGTVQRLQIIGES